jgi:hypothetical protein
MAITNQSPKYFTLTSPNASSDATPSVVEKAIAKAEVMLKAVNAKYIVVLPDGSVISQGGLELAQPKQAIQRKRRDSAVPHGAYTVLLQANGFDAMEKSDVLQVDVGLMAPESVRGVACSRAAKLWGAGSVITTVNGSTVEILRVS